jgi:hypothetical protein
MAVTNCCGLGSPECMHTMLVLEYCRSALRAFADPPPELELGNPVQSGVWYTSCLKMVVVPMVLVVIMSEPGGGR